MKRVQAFTLIEILMAFALFAAVGGILISLILEGMNSREEAAQLTTAVHLAAQKMDAIKNKRSEESSEGKFKAFPSFSYKWEIKKIELDLAKMLSGESEGEEDVEDSKAQISKYLKEFGLSRETVTGAVFKMLKYEVTVFYGNNKNYHLVFYRGLGVF